MERRGTKKADMVPQEPAAPGTPAMAGFAAREFPVKLTCNRAGMHIQHPLPRRFRAPRKSVRAPEAAILPLFGLTFSQAAVHFAQRSRDKSQAVLGALSGCNRI